MMNKTEFLAALRRELGFLPKDELDDAIRYYDEYINDAGDDEEKVIAEMGTPHKAESVSVLTDFVCSCFAATPCAM